MENNRNSLIENKNVLMMLNLSAFSYIFLPFLGFFVPLLMWLSNRKKTIDMDKAGKRILNFQLTWSIMLLAWFLTIAYGQEFLLKLVESNGVGSKIRIQESGIVVLYFYNFIFIAFNTLRISKQKNLFFIPSIPFFRSAN